MYVYQRMMMLWTASAGGAAPITCGSNPVTTGSAIVPDGSADVAAYAGVASVSACCDLCSANPRCKGFTVAPTFSGDSIVCSLKSRSSPIVPMEGAISWAPLELAPDRITLGNNFLWYSPLHPIWTSVFMRSSDQLPDLSNVITCMRSLRQHEMELVTVIGGMAYLNFMGNVRFNRVTYFDLNINEVSKLLLAHRHLATRSFAEYDYFKDVDRQIREQPANFYLPQPLTDAGFTLTSDEDEFVFPPKGWEPPGDSMWTLLPPKENCAGGGCWEATEETYNRVREAVRADVNKDVYLGLPSMNVTAPVVFVYVDGIPGLDQDLLEKSFPNAEFVVPIRAHVDDSEAVTEVQHLLMQKCSSTHMWWEIMVKLYMGSVATTHMKQQQHYHQQHQDRQQQQEMVSMHIWSSEYKQFVGSEYDKPFTFSNMAEDFLRILAFNHVDVIVLHMLLGTHKWQPALGMAQGCEERQAQFKAVLAKATQVARKRVIVTDHNAEAGGGTVFAHTCALSSAALVNSVGAIVAGAGAGQGNSQFSVVDSRFCPGEGMPKRNIFVIVDRVETINDESSKRSGETKATRQEL